jgi:hypothetical protein
MDIENTKGGDKIRNDLYDFDDFIRYQLEIAERWLEKGNKTKEIFSKFFFYFAGFNSIYFLWKTIENPNQKGQENHIENLIKHFDDEKIHKILGKIGESVEYFCERQPIQQMEKRKKEDFCVGDETKGSKYNTILQNKNNPAKKRIIALGKILYLIRCNLVHGSKEDSGDDEEIIEKSLRPLKIFLDEAISWTRLQCPWER